MPSDDIQSKCAKKANELIAAYSGGITTAGIMLLVHEAVLSGAQLGVEAVSGMVDKGIAVATGAGKP